jgi:hypothetical protein
MLAAAKYKSKYLWLEPPASLGRVSIEDIDQVMNANDHKALVKRWARQMWGRLVTVP